MIVRKLTKEEWKPLSEQAHLVVFNEAKDASIERIDFALVAEDKDQVPCSYTTCRELDADSLYFQYGGSFPGTKGTTKSIAAFEGFVRWAKEAGYKRVTFYVENWNAAMLKLAMRTGFLITGVRNYKSHVLVEHLLEF